MRFCRAMQRWPIWLLWCLLLAFPVLVQGAEPAITESLVRQVANAVEQGDANPQAAIAALGKLLKRQRQPLARAYVVQQKAALHIRVDEAAQARDELAAVLSGQPADFAGPLRLMLGQTYLMLDEFEAALMALEIWLSAQKEPDPNGLFLLGFAHLRAEQLDLAITRLEQAMATVQEVPRNHWIELLAYAYARAGRPEQAQQLLERLIARDASQARWWRQLASVLLLMEETQSGTAALAIAEQLKPESRASAVRLARFLAHVGMPADGAQLLAAAFASGESPVTLKHQLLLAEMWLLAREFDAAIAAFERAEEIDPHDGKAAWIMGQMYLHWERYADAATTLSRAALLYGEEAPGQVHYLLAISFINLKDYPAARRALRMLGEEGAYAAKGAALERYIDNVSKPS